MWKVLQDLQRDKQRILKEGLFSYCENRYSPLVKKELHKHILLAKQRDTASVNNLINTIRYQLKLKKIKHYIVVTSFNAIEIETLNNSMKEFFSFEADYLRVITKNLRKKKFEFFTSLEKMTSCLRRRDRFHRKEHRLQIKLYARQELQRIEDIGFGDVDNVEAVKILPNVNSGNIKQMKDRNFFNEVNPRFSAIPGSIFEKLAKSAYMADCLGSEMSKSKIHKNVIIVTGK